MAANFNLSRGFLPTQDPLKQLPPAFAAWENIAANLRKWLVSDQLRATLENMPAFPVMQLKTAAEIDRAMLILSFFGHAYVWGSAQPVAKIPAVLAKPWYEVSKLLQRPPVLSYASYALTNWQRLDTNRDIELGNIVLLQNFHGGIDEEWFVLVHVAIEAKAAAALQVLLLAQQAVQENDHAALLMHLTTIAETMEKICAILDRMPEHCDPYIYFHRVRPYIHAWKDNPAMQEGMIYEGVAEYKNEPQMFRGETGAQSSIIPSLDAVLGIKHANDQLSIYLQDMRNYMPVQHRAFLHELESRPDVRDYVVAHKADLPALAEQYNRCVELMVRFRLTHLHYAATYIHKQAHDSATNLTDIGTGGTPFMTYLRKHEEETLKYKVLLSS